MSKDTEIDLKDVELNEMDPEKQPMTGDGPAAGSEKNGSVKLKVPDDEVKFTGLSKEELMRVAGTPGWVRLRWVLLVLFWLGWIGMLAGAIVIIVQAPRCKPLPEMGWWNEGPLYQISNLMAFSSDGIKGVEKKLESVNQLKVKGLVLGPFHTVQAEQPNSLHFKEIDPNHGTKEDLRILLDKAHKKGISVVLDMTPNYLGKEKWFSNAAVADVLEQLKDAAEYWLGVGVDGIKVPDLQTAVASSEWSMVQATIQGNRTNDEKKRALIGVVEGISALNVSLLLNTSGVDLILSDLLRTNVGGMERSKAIDTLMENSQFKLGWGLGAAKGDHLSKVVATPGLVRLYQLLLLTMPGTPVFTYGDEIGLQGSGSPTMLWDSEVETAEEAVNQTAEAERKERVACRRWFKTLSELRGKERSLLHGDYYPLQSSATSLAFLRLWDQSERYITAVNWATTPTTLTLTPRGQLELPKQAKVTLSTDPELKLNSMVDLNKVTLGPGQGVLLQFPLAA
ncbi:solute carrier family 3 member 2a [Lampris incognitus]|uniref:solute carrier family 3 member 2a n=1 Tax=Lampris incognitus TaxID=2546036 RepID=UPI0024B5D545|nr:solute carrier family 3 member 2a [Lampris incognitus]XP_056155997.1 solute carrier family 3 member 2a [Lampris incognitus]